MRLTQLLIESSLSRVWQHINNPNSTFAIISAFLDEEDDIKNHENLKRDVRNLKLGFIEMKSGYSYQTDDGEEFAEEKSLLIPEITKEQAFTLAKKYNQQSIIFKDNSGLKLIGTRSDVGVGKELTSFSNNVTFDSDLVKKAYSSLVKSHANNKKKFAFISEIKERRIMDYPTCLVYKEVDVPEWFKIA